MEKRTLLEYHDLSVEVEDQAGEEILAHMYSTTMGTPGGFRYHHTELEERLRSGHEDYFLYLRKSGQMMGSVGFVGKHTTTRGVKHDSWLIRYFSIKAPMRTTPTKRLQRSEDREDRKRSSVLGRFVRPLFSNPSQLRPGNPEQGPAIIFAIIEQENLRSMNFSEQMGLETIGIMKGFSFSRLRPKLSERMEQVEAADQPAVLEQIRSFYKDYTLFFEDGIFKQDDYYVIREKGRMLAGVQCYPVTWDVVDYGSAFANRMMPLLTRIPWFARRFPKGRISFLAFDATYYEAGREELLYELLESVLALKGLYFGMMMLDMDTDLYRVFENRQKLGLLQKVIGDFEADIRVRFVEMDEKLREHFRRQPTYVPTNDNT